MINTVDGTEFGMEVDFAVDRKTRGNKTSESVEINQFQPTGEA